MLSELMPSSFTYRFLYHSIIFRQPSFTCPTIIFFALIHLMPSWIGSFPVEAFFQTRIFCFGHEPIVYGFMTFAIR